MSDLVTTNSRSYYIISALYASVVMSTIKTSRMYITQIARLTLAVRFITIALKQKCLFQRRGLPSTRVLPTLDQNLTVLFSSVIILSNIDGLK